jgi:hypothetical protein
MPCRKVTAAFQEAKEEAAGVVGVVEESVSAALGENLRLHSQPQELDRFHG